MAEDKLNSRIDKLFDREAWDDARRILERERKKNPRDHWVLTQLGVTFYEQRQYEEALQLFVASQRIVPDCPLTLWNLAGALDALGRHASALRIYTWILRCKKSADKDPCWESKQWADALRTDCVYRVGVCFQHLGKKRKAEDCYRQYLELLSIGIEGSYSIDDVKRQIRDLQGAGRAKAVASEVRKAVSATLLLSGVDQGKGRSSPLLELNVPDLVPSR